MNDYKYVNKKGDAKHFFPKKLSEENGVLLNYGKYEIEMAPVLDVKKEGEEDGDEPGNDAGGGTETEEETTTGLHSDINVILYNHDEYDYKVSGD